LFNVEEEPFDLLGDVIRVCIRIADSVIIATVMTGIVSELQGYIIFSSNTTIASVATLGRGDGVTETNSTVILASMVVLS
jgi:hypothetical protein